MNREEKMGQMHILACISASPTSQRVIEASAKAASLYECAFTALYIASDDTLPPEVELNLDFAKKNGANTVILKGGNPAERIAQYALKTDVTDLYIGKSGPDFFLAASDRFLKSLMRRLPDAEIHVIPAPGVVLRRSRIHPDVPTKLNSGDVFRTVLVMGIATLLSWMFDRSIFSNANIITIYILAVLITSVITSDRIYGVVASLMYILLFNVLFIEPRWSLVIYDMKYMVTYLVTIIAALITGTLEDRMKKSTRLANENAEQSRILLDCSELLQHARDEADVIRITSGQLTRLLHRSVVFYPIADNHLSEARVFHSEGDENNDLTEEKDVAQWVYENNRHAGAYTGVHAEARCQYLSVRVSEEEYGVIGVDMVPGELNDFENNILLSLIGQCAMTLSTMRTDHAREAAEIAMEKEHFRATILRSISHDLRTPLTSISGNANNLLRYGDTLSKEETDTICQDMVDDSQWLIELIENLLSVTKLAEGKYLKPETEILQDVIHEAMKHIDRHSSEHEIAVDLPDDPVLTFIDSKLIMQVIINLVNNAIKYTPQGSHITVRAVEDADTVRVSVSDDGEGIADKEHVGEMFWTGHHALADSRRSIGLGLSLCHAIIKAHGTELKLTDNVPHGCIFTFELRKEKLADDRL